MRQRSTLSPLLTHRGAEREYGEVEPPVHGDRVDDDDGAAYEDGGRAREEQRDGLQRPGGAGGGTEGSQN